MADCKSTAAAGGNTETHTTAGNDTRAPLDAKQISAQVRTALAAIEHADALEKIMESADHA